MSTCALATQVARCDVLRGDAAPTNGDDGLGAPPDASPDLDQESRSIRKISMDGGVRSILRSTPTPPFDPIEREPFVV